MDRSLDKIVCRGFAYECEIGIYACEHKISQRVTVDLVAWVRPIPAAERERAASIRFDYFDANHAIRAICAERSYQLLETLTEVIAERLLAGFAIEAVEVSATKYPLDMPNAQSVSYVCYRTRASSEGANGG